MSVLFWLSLNVALIFMLVNAIMIFIKFGTWGTMITEALNEALALIMLIMVLKYRKNSSYLHDAGHSDFFQASDGKNTWYVSINEIYPYELIKKKIQEEFKKAPAKFIN
ncbi:hypothetical protein WBM82_00480 (plasmid) [Bacillus subtilis]